MYPYILNRFKSMYLDRNTGTTHRLDVFAKCDRYHADHNAKRATGRLRPNGAVLLVLAVASNAYAATNRLQRRRMQAASRSA